MVTFPELLNAKPDMWISAADDLLAAAKQCERIEDDIHYNGTRPLTDNWSGQAFGAAHDSLVRIANRSQVASILARGVVDPLDTLGHAVGVAQRELHAAVDYARSRGLDVDNTTGVVTIPDEQAGDIMLCFVQDEATEMIQAALAAATRADGDCTTALQILKADDNDSTTLKAAQEAQQKIGIAKALQEMRDLIPSGATREEAFRWWLSLTPQQQNDFERACPVEIFDLNGIPDTVKAAIDRPENGFSSVGAVRWALAHRNDDSIDDYPNNCANFVSYALSEGGSLPYKSDHSFARFDHDGWGVDDDPYLDPLGISDNFPGLTHTKSWSLANAQRDFFLHHGGASISPNQARPGDLSYWEYTQHGVTEDGDPMTPGQAHHAAIVTGVLPDGQVVYTQHTSNDTDLALQGRLPEVSQSEGQQHITIVTPKRTW
ncbi:amidase domain-containing protein [Gordonia sp. DT219]|uniref:amidase domain-containing protein n=1 Tax=Gordonia sp. DT219 TaxID=3416658 RepID=UPI003CED1D46